ncbi:hypothetical protein F3Y22_tig00111584pilonHSYRG00008 [Hibiscus syriacus]|uniref:Uncharacterized protein n=1 Tax=Hibiscus syriacus TaxID=106335 RepID=A0A6A2Y5S9_HIBSY|nr:hypothetical protein F3Y22_tig00111584pilonHSYRG00008 [Hibiscus syriacus]
MECRQWRWRRRQWGIGPPGSEAAAGILEVSEAAGILEASEAAGGG